MNIIKIFLLFIIPLSACTQLKDYKNSQVYFLKEATPRGEAYYSRASVSGKLIVKNGCFFLRDTFSKESLLIWPWDYNYRVTNNTISVIDSKGEVISKAGTYLKASGGYSLIKDFNLGQIKNINKCYMGGELNVVWIGK